MILRPSDLKICDIWINFNLQMFEILEIDLAHVNKGGRSNFTKDEARMIFITIIEGLTLLPKFEVIMNPYRADIERLKESKEIKDEKELLKLKLVSAFLKATSKMSTEEILILTKLHKSDFSRIRAMNINRFTIDRIIGLLGDLGFSTQINVKPKKAS